LLRVDLAFGDRGNRFGEIEPQRRRAQEREGSGLDLARQDPDAQPSEIGRGANRAYTVRDLPESVLEEAEDAVVHALLDLAGEHPSELAVHRGTRLPGIFEQERKIDQPKLRDAIGQIAARLVAEREQPMLDQP